MISLWVMVVSASMRVSMMAGAGGLGRMMSMSLVGLTSPRAMLP